jgi:hypothetical protein
MFQFNLILVLSNSVDPSLVLNRLENTGSAEAALWGTHNCPLLYFTWLRFPLQLQIKVYKETLPNDGEKEKPTGENAH